MAEATFVVLSSPKFPSDPCREQDLSTLLSQSLYSLLQENSPSLTLFASLVVCSSPDSLFYLFFLWSLLEQLMFWMPLRPVLFLSFAASLITSYMGALKHSIRNRRLPLYDVIIKFRNKMSQEQCLNSGGYSYHLVHMEHPKVIASKHASSQPSPISPHHHADNFNFLLKFSPTWNPFHFGVTPGYRHQNWRFTDPFDTPGNVLSWNTILP